MSSVKSEIMQASSSLAVPLLDLKAQYKSIRTEVRAAIDRVADAQYFINGPEVEALEQEIAVYSQAECGIGVSSGTDALLVSMMAIDIQPGDEVITTPYSFFATAGSIARLGAKPVFADIDPFSYNLRAEAIEAVITPRTRAIMPVHLYGQVAEMDDILEIAARHNLVVIEDAAQAIGAEYKSKRAGSIGTLGCFSFFPSKNLGGFGDAGMVVTNEPALARRIKQLRSHGDGPKYYHRLIGGNFRLDALQAAVLRVKLKYLDEWTKARQRNAALYRTLFEAAGLASRTGNGAVTLPHESPHRRHIYNQFVIRVERRDELRAYLQRHEIGCEVYYPVPLHLQECFTYLGHVAGAFPASEAAAHETLALPVYPELTTAMIERVVTVIGESLLMNS